MSRKPCGGLDVGGSCPMCDCGTILPEVLELQMEALTSGLEAELARVLGERDEARRTAHDLANKVMGLEGRRDEHQRAARAFLGATSMGARMELGGLLARLELAQPLPGDGELLEALALAEGVR